MSGCSSHTKTSKLYTLTDFKAAEKTNVEQVVYGKYEPLEHRLSTKYRCEFYSK